MLNKNINLKYIELILQSLPEGVNIISIDLSDGYNIIMQAGDNEIKTLAKEKALADMNKQLASLRMKDLEHIDFSRLIDNFIDISLIDSP